jgi:hypothetical protein
LSAIIEENNSNGWIKSCSYILRFSSGKEEEVNFNECDILNEGEKIRIKYLETMIIKRKLPIAFEKLLRNEVQQRQHLLNKATLH